MPRSHWISRTTSAADQPRQLLREQLIVSLRPVGGSPAARQIVEVVRDRSYSASELSASSYAGPEQSC